MIAIRGGGSTIVKALVPLLIKVGQRASDETAIEFVARDQPMPLNAERYFFCAGVLHGKRHAEKTDNEYRECWRVNCDDIIEDCNRILEANASARIVVMGSESGFAGSYDDDYAYAKHRLHHWVENKELLCPQQQLVCVAPSIIADSGMTLRRTDRDNLQFRRNTHPKRRFVSAHEVARLVHFLLYVDLGYISNTVIRMNGGEHLKPKHKDDPNPLWPGELSRDYLVQVATPPRQASGPAPEVAPPRAQAGGRVSVHYAGTPGDLESVRVAGYRLAGDHHEDLMKTKSREQIAALHAALELVGKDRKGRIAIDGGAHRGDWTRVLADQFAHVHAFEPASDMFATLVQNCADLTNVYAYRSALWRESGNATLHDCHAGQTRGRFITPNGGTVEMRTIDWLELGCCGLIKLDLEGAEFDALVGAAATLRRCRPILIVECKDKHLARYNRSSAELTRYLDAAGYHEHKVRFHPDRIFVPNSSS